MSSLFLRRPSVTPSRAYRQRGAALYVALIVLILLAMIGIIGMQVSGIQERMAASYRAVNVAFQSAEAALRSTECTIQDIEDRTSTPGCDVIAEASIERHCDTGFDVDGWLAMQGAAPAYNVRQIDECIVGESSLAMGVGPAGETAPIRIYQITVYSADDDTNQTSASAIDAVYKL